MKKHRLSTLLILGAVILAASSSAQPRSVFELRSADMDLLQELSAEQVATFLSGEDPKRIVLDDGSTLAEWLALGGLVCPSAGDCLAIKSTPAVWQSGWLSAPMRNELTLTPGVAHDFIFGLFRSPQSLGGTVITPIMGATSVNHMPAYVALDNTSFDVVGYDEGGSLRNVGSRNNLSLTGGEVRYTAILKTPDYDSTWFQCGVNQTYNLLHGLGTLPTLAMVEVAENSDGSGWRVPTMSTSNYSGAWRQTALVALDTTQAVVRTHGSLAYFRNTATGTAIAPSSGYCRVRLWDWRADYDSGWVPTSTAVGDQDKWFQHGFGALPSLVMLWVAEDPDSSGWILPAMGGYHYIATYGVGLFSLSEDWAVVKGSPSNLAHFINGVGTAQSPNSGYVRFLAWH